MSARKQQLLKRHRRHKRIALLVALLLMALMFQFGLEQRLPEVGMLLAVGGVLWATRPAPAASAATSGPDTEAGHGD